MAIWNDRTNAWDEEKCLTFAAQREERFRTAVLNYLEEIAATTRHGFSDMAEKGEERSAIVAYLRSMGEESAADHIEDGAHTEKSHG